MPQMLPKDLEEFMLDFTVTSKKLKFAIQIQFLPPGSSSWRRTVVPSNVLWTSLKEHLLDGMEIPRKHYNRYKFEYSFGENGKMRYELMDSRHWNDLRNEIRGFFVDKSKTSRAIKSKLPVQIHAVDLVGGNFRYIC
jgi:hypothetical protein